MSNQNFAPGTASQNDLTVEVELTISGKNLLNKDVMSKSDPICVVYIQNTNSHSWTEHARTERLINTLNPEFATKIQIGYRFEELQKIKFKIYDIDCSSSTLDDQDFLGEAETTLGQLVSSGNVALPLKSIHPNGKNQGQLIVKTEEVGSIQEEIEFQFSAENFKKSGLFSKPDPFLAIYKDDNLVFRTSFIKDNCDPKWPKFTVPMRAIRTKDGQDVTLKLQCWNWNGNGNHTLMGEVQVTTQEILHAPSTFLLNEKKLGKSNGKLCLNQAIVRRAYTFLEYVTLGTELNCTIAIDFTASNGSPNTPSSLHYMGPNPTLYELVLQSVVTIIQDYDSDKQFPVLGFGAKVPPSGTLSHEFFVNLSSSPFCSEVGGVIEAYRKCLPLVQLYGPTCFAPVIKHVSQFAASHPNGDKYFILLILTDGEICDMQETKQAIIAASHLPMSIIIVGIGNADFSSMNELDSDEGLLSMNGRAASRDIVQFVPFNNFLNQPDPYRAGADLARALLAEIPNQLVGYMKSRNLAPKRSV